MLSAVLRGPSNVCQNRAAGRVPRGSDSALTAEMLPGDDSSSPQFVPCCIVLCLLAAALALCS